nr:uncharacterized protein LOC103347245 isoform X2 [Oryctolagus cuniculus]
MPICGCQGHRWWPSPLNPAPAPIYRSLKKIYVLERQRYRERRLERMSPTDSDQAKTGLAGPPPVLGEPGALLPPRGLGGAAAQVRPCWPRVHHTSSAAGRDTKNGAAAMAMMAGNAACFQRGSLFWFAVLTLSFGYCMVGVSELGQQPAASALSSRRPPPLGGWPRRHSCCLDPPSRKERRTRKVAQAQSTAKAFGRCSKPCENSWPGFPHVGAGTTPHQTTESHGACEHEGRKGCYRLLPYGQPLPSLVTGLGLGYFAWLSSGRRASLMRALGSWARSLSPWWTIITPSCTTGRVTTEAETEENLPSTGSFPKWQQ